MQGRWDRDIEKKSLHIQYLNVRVRENKNENAKKKEKENICMY